MCKALREGRGEMGRGERRAKDGGGVGESGGEGRRERRGENTLTM